MKWGRWFFPVCFQRPLLKIHAAKAADKIGLFWYLPERYGHAAAGWLIWRNYINFSLEVGPGLVGSGLFIKILSGRRDVQKVLIRIL